ncbi:hypothetical protein [Streptomyces morookaense]|uniref:Secreted protein n=1 Tax=Streptomyces morookaense TaxID=1970 RepID=A0A7Y7B721_STRMO|nr:hypothetical protein [Streptomyces morookaense]NVK80164.1 hypothetical protein [Streptomyces morookaense]GHF29175.1 hypothetical protein GCM10010359_34560 [Streptomyces morookaense]
MRLRRALLTLASALTLALSVSTSAYAEATGNFSYFADDNGVAVQHKLDDPPLNECVDVADDETVYVYKVQNTTDAYADVYENLTCGGTKTTLAPLSDEQPETLHIRSVRFRPTSTS